MMRIAMLGHKRVPSREGGIEVVVEELSTRMVALGHHVTCYNRNRKNVSVEEKLSDKINEYRGVRIKRVFTYDKKGYAAVTSSFFAAWKAALGPYDVIHFHAEGPAAVLWIPKMFGKRCVVTVHGLDHQREKWGGFASRYILFGEKCAVKFADEIIVLSKAVQQYFMDLYGRETRFIPNAVNRPVLRKSNLINKFGIESREYILYMARLVPEKGLKYLIEAYKHINTDKKLVISGSIFYLDEFYQEVRKMAEDDERIIFTDFVDGELLEELFSNAYVYTLPSDLEGMPMSLLEAMSYGNCCLVSDIPECTEVVNDKAVIFKKGNVEELREKLQMLCDNEHIVEEYRSMTSDYICDKYKWDDVVEQTLELYKKTKKK